MADACVEGKARAEEQGTAKRDKAAKPKAAPKVVEISDTDDADVTEEA
jgi:small subunit ribosomal protein S2